MNSILYSCETNELNGDAKYSDTNLTTETRYCTRRELVKRTWNVLQNRFCAWQVSNTKVL